MKKAVFFTLMGLLFVNVASANNYNYYCAQSSCQQADITGDSTTVTLPHSTISYFYIHCKNIAIPSADFSYDTGVSAGYSGQLKLGEYEYDFLNWGAIGSQHVTVKDIHC
jgi:hypothetical protein